MRTVAEIVRKQEQDYREGTTQISKYVQFNLRENVEKIDAYLNSKHTTGEKDSKGRDKPFFNIVTAATNIWYRATDIDRKNIRIKPTKSAHTLAAFLATVHLRDWMNRSGFGKFLNEWGRVLARYGSAVLKFTTKDGELVATVVPWNRLIIDAIDFNNNVKIEKLELTEAQLRQNKNYDQDMVEALCDAKASRTTTDGLQKDAKSDYITLYEVHGVLPLALLNDSDSEESDDTYVQQMHVVSFVQSEDSHGNKEWMDYTLFKSKEDDPYMITHLIAEDGRSQSIGAVEHLFEAQWMVNHTAKAIKDQLDLASKLIFQTSDPNFVGQNALNAIETGQILIHRVNEPLTQLQNNSHDITSLQNFQNQWKALSNEVAGISESMLGNTAPSGTAWRQVEAILNESHSLFEVMTENKGLDIEEMMRRFVIPFVKTKMDTVDEISATLSDYEIHEIDASYIKAEGTRRYNQKVVELQLNNIIPSITPEMEMMKVQGELSGAKRFFKPSEIPSKTWKDTLKDLEWEVEVDVTGEQTFSRDDLATVSTVFQTIADPMKRQVLDTPEGKMLFNKILALTGAVSPIELQTKKSPVPTAMPAQPSPMSPILPSNQTTQ